MHSRSYFDVYDWALELCIVLHFIVVALLFLPCGFYLLSSFSSWPNLSGRRLDVDHTSTHGVALVRI